MPISVAVRGSGRVDVAAYGMQDAEHLVQKELQRLWPGARVEVLEIRMGTGSRIVDEYRVAYRVRATVEVDSIDAKEAPRIALRHARGLLSGSRYEKIDFQL